MGSILNDFEILDLLNMDELIWLEEAPPVHYTLDLADSVTLSEVVGSNFQIGLGDSVGLEDEISLTLSHLASPIVSTALYPSVVDMYLGASNVYSLIATHADGSQSNISHLATWSIIGSPVAAEFDLKYPWQLNSVAVGSGIVVANYPSISPPATGVFTVHSPMIVAQSEDRAGAYAAGTAYYLRFITSQYQNSPNFLAWISGFLDILQNLKDLSDNLAYYFSFSRIVDKDSGVYIPGALTVEQGDYAFAEMDAAIGDQLDILGVILGVGRTVNFMPTGGLSSILDDETYRLLLKNKVIRNHWDGRASTIQEAWKSLFPGGTIIVQDNQNMTVDVTITGGFSQLIIDLIEHDYIVPRPQGVLMNYYVGTVSPSNLPFFGFDRDDTYVSGFDKGHWV